MCETSSRPRFCCPGSERLLLVLMSCALARGTRVHRRKSWRKRVKPGESFCLRFLASFLILVAEVDNGCLDGTQMRPAIVGTARIWRATITTALLAGKSKIALFHWFFGSRTLVDREALALPPLTKLHVQTLDEDPN